ncbi:hypothetical protein NQ318_011454 [Aromia moschata]|uniref:Partner of Y14 and mago n=1 Tax=Aromia moschata TaxID=1265417 RepID=A0AAV8X8E5_9CUCU|nr:hypothetical protein NQ318_011454 [Aromia moschata]
MSGYSNVINENGEQFIPASQRPDGTWRKARRVKDGYVPQEEVPLYESKGKQFMTRKQQPSTPGKIVHHPIPGLCIEQEEKQKKISKKKNKKNVEIINQDINNHFENMTITENSRIQDNNQHSLNKETTDPIKKLKNLRKRLREIEGLEEKLKNGSLIKPEPEQMVKLKRKSELLEQISKLEKEVPH